eukprot:TRINITY_DN51491_c0_g1_i1.p1 TRINITY_DN51491_c0_g1~~TRINITY_DN51491_c0_g1_i1.p1  ORF type:complete len:492 (-),score=80.01 TRINITY_DN51491_c0_g1_i1:32-1312(-)
MSSREGSLEADSATTRHDRTFYRFESYGDSSAVSIMEKALEYQWLYGYPSVPPGFEQLTHGTFKYLAGMQGITAKEMLSLVPGARTVLDMFCGSGTVLIEALASGKMAFGCDASPLAVFVASHHCDVSGLDVEELRQAARELAEDLPLEPGDWNLLRERLQQMPASPLRGALRFVLLVALQRSADINLVAAQSDSQRDFLSTGFIQETANGRFAKPMFLQTAERYTKRLLSLRSKTSTGVNARITRCDCRQLKLNEPVDAIITGPPYPGVYDYLNAANVAKQSLLWGDEESEESETEQSVECLPGMKNGMDEELGARRLWRQDTESEKPDFHTFLKAWQKQQEEWMAAAHRNLKPGGTATLMIGDGDTEEVNGIDCLTSTLDAAKAVGFEVLATSSILSTVKSGRRVKGRRRTEHMVHLLKPKGCE